MPTTYAHWRFGADCIETLPDNLKQIINTNRAIYDYGVHGPDVLFYDLTHPSIPKYGSKLHHQPARSFFEDCVRIYKENPEDKDKMLSYLLGFLSHYTLDSQCHGYINRKSQMTPGLSHNKVESEYDGHLMRLDGRSINHVDRSVSLIPDKKDAEVMSRFFPFNKKELYRTCKAHHFIIHALNCKSNFKRTVLGKTLEKLRLPAYRDLIVHNDELDVCKDSNLRIDKLRAYALELYPKLVENMMEAINDNQALSSYFEHDFDPEAPNSPVLSYEEELNYTPERID